MRKLLFILLPLLAVAGALYLLVLRPATKPEPQKASSPTVRLDDLKKGDAKDQQNQSEPADSKGGPDFKNDVPSKPDSPKGNEVVSRRPARLNSAQRRELGRALAAVRPGSSYRLSLVALKRQGARKINEQRRGGMLYSIFLLQSRKQYVLVMHRADQVVSTLPATKQ